MLRAGPPDAALAAIPKEPGGAKGWPIGRSALRRAPVDAGSRHRHDQVSKSRRRGRVARAVAGRDGSRTRQARRGGPASLGFVRQALRQCAAPAPVSPRATGVSVPVSGRASGPRLPPVAVVIARAGLGVVAERREVVVGSHGRATPRLRAVGLAVADVGGSGGRSESSACLPPGQRPRRSRPRQSLVRRVESASLKTRGTMPSVCKDVRQLDERAAGGRGPPCLRSARRAGSD